MQRTWSVHPPVDDAVGIARALSIHPLVASILMRRGLRTTEEMRLFLNPSADDIPTPFLYPDMTKAVDRIRRAIRDRETILVYGDYDVDGVTASAVLVPILLSLGAKAHIHLPHRISEGYGLNIDSLKGWLSRGVSLVITVDNGITGFDQVEFLKNSGVDVILVDHHVPKDRMPPADAIITGEPLAACGLAFKLGWALLGDFSKAEPYLDLVTLGTVADLAPVEGENRILLKLGLPKLARTKRQGLRALMDAAGIYPEAVTYRDIAFGLGPRINAAGRMGHPMEAYRLLVTDDFSEARKLAQLLEDGNRQRQKSENEAFKQAARQVEENFAGSEHRVLVVESPEWHEGVLGIVATRLVEKFRKPSIVISIKDVVGKGSGRSVPDFSLFKHVLACEALLESFGGHAQACGLSIRRDRLEAFRKMLNETARANDSALSDAEALWIDSEVPAEALGTSLLRDLERLSPFGPGNPRPLFLSRNMTVKGEPRKRGKDTLQCWISDASGKVTCEAIGFRLYERWQKEMKGRRDCDIVYQPTLRNSKGIEFIELQLESWR